MATSKDFLNYFAEQTKALANVTFRPMMGEYLIYYKGRLIGDICDNTVFIKPVEVAKRLMPEAELKPPYKGARDMLVLDDTEDIQFIQTLFEAVYPVLPSPKVKKRK